METEQELNKKLAEWRGLALIDIVDFIDKGELWMSFKDRDGIIYNLLAFTRNETACFKWFKPKFKSIACGSLNEDNWKGAWAKVITHKGETAWSQEPDIDPALALCKAIEKLIDAEAK